MMIPELSGVHMNSSFEVSSYSGQMVIEKIYCIYPANFHLFRTVGKHDAREIRYSYDSFDKFKKINT